MYTGIRYTTGAPKSGAPSSPRATHGTHRRRAANRQIQADQNDGNDELSSSPSPSLVIGHHQTVQAVDSRSGQLHLKITASHDRQMPATSQRRPQGGPASGHCQWQHNSNRQQDRGTSPI
ncbi:hypothetical protein ACLOJK_035008 [Asimina triloba]